MCLTYKCLAWHYSPMNMQTDDFVNRNE